MIKITGNAIELKQGDSGAIRFFFKDKQTDFPYILGPLDTKYSTQSAIKFVVRQDPSDSSKAVIERYYFLDKKPEGDYKYFYRFNSNEILEYNPDKGLPVGGLQPDTLYYMQSAKDPNGWEFFFYRNQVDDAHKETYDYINSSIDIVFKPEDTKDLFYKTYYYEIAYIEGNNLEKDNKDEKINFKNTLIESAPFIVTGALVK